MGFSALRQYGYLRKDNLALGIGAGHEGFMYMLTNEVKLVVGTDLYGETDFSQSEADPAVLRDPSQFWAFPYERENLLVMKMDATKIVFGDSLFDILFSFSSLEHFGETDKIQQAMCEAFRVLKPGGIYVLAVDHILHPAPTPAVRDSRVDLAGAAFTRDEVLELVGTAGFLLKEPVAFDVPRSSVGNVYDNTTRESSSGNWFPHIYLGYEDYLFSSLFLALFKSPDR